MLPIGKHSLIQWKTSDNVTLSDVFRWISACFPIGLDCFSSSVTSGYFTQTTQQPEQREYEIYDTNIRISMQ